MKFSIKRGVAGALALILMPVCLSFASFAAGSSDRPIELTIDSAMQKGLDYSHKAAEIDQTLESLWEQENELMESSNEIQALLDKLERFKKLHEKRSKGTTFTVEEQDDYFMFQMMFGLTPSMNSSEEMFTKYIKPRDFPHYSVWATYQNTKTSKELTKASVTLGIHQLYTSVLDLQDTLKLQQKLYDNMVTQNNQLLAKYKLGQVSEVDKYTSEIRLKQQKLQVDKLKRSLDSLEISLKQQCGIPINQKITLKPYEVLLKEPLAVNKYLDKALLSRYEVVTTKMDLQVKQRELDIMKQYITNELLSDRLEAQQAVDEKTIATKEAVDSVTADIHSGYIDVKAKRAAISTTYKQKMSAEIKLKDATSKYQKGSISLVDLWSYHTALTQAEISYSKAERAYNSSLYKLEVACGVGPGYISR